jgi:hypothetical protein
VADPAPWENARPVKLSYTCDKCKHTTTYDALPAWCEGCGIMITEPVLADPDRACPHEDFECIVAIQRACEVEGGPVVGFYAEITVACAGCGEKFRFRGCPAGQFPDRPAVSVDETELRAPIRPASSDPDFGLGLPGYAVRYREPGEAAPEGRRDYGPRQ